MSTESRKQMKKRAFLFSGMTKELQWTLDSTGVARELQKRLRPHMAYNFKILTAGRLTKL